jgi:hypothetical protein
MEALQQSDSFCFLFYSFSAFEQNPMPALTIKIVSSYEIQNSFFWLTEEKLKWDNNNVELRT